MKRAGDVMGIPHWQTDPNPTLDDLIMPPPDRERQKDAADALSVAISRLQECISWCDHASGDVDGLPAADSILSFINSLEDVLTDVEDLQTRLSEGGE